MRPRILVAALLLTLLAAGCGGESGGSGEATTVAEQPPSPRAAVAAESICSELVARAGRMGTEFSTEPDPTEGTSGALDLTTRKLIKPAIPIVEDAARRLRALRPQADSVRFDSYVNLFDPVTAILRERVEAGEAGDPTRARELELQLIDLSDLQRRLAREAGLEDCDVDFIQAFAGGGAQ